MRAALGVFCLLVGLTARAAVPDVDPASLELAGIARVVVAVRGLPLVAPLRVVTIDREEFGKRVRARVGAERSAGDAAGEALALIRLGLLDTGVDHAALLADRYADELAGTYDPAAGEILVVDGLADEARRQLLAHEVAHALQDRAFGLTRFVRPTTGNGDARLARQALVEGDALATMIEWQRRVVGDTGDPWAEPGASARDASVAGASGGRLARLPAVVREAIAFPHEAGLRFVAELRRFHSWRRVDELYARPPESTEAVLHPERFLAGERPVRVAAPAPAVLAKWRVVHEDVLGEHLIGVWLRQHGVGARQSGDAAEGWGGDRFRLYSPPGIGVPADLLLVSISVWDAELDAIEAHAAFAESLGALLGAAPTSRAGEVVRFTDGAGRIALVERQGDRVLLVMGAPERLLAKLRAQVWRRAR